jgi:phosphoribosylformylglycinamidine synthase
MWQVSEAIDGITAACNELDTPITGGNVSFYNETLGSSIYPTPVIGILGVIEDAANVVKLNFRNSGDIILLLDGMTPAPQTATSTAARKSESAREFSSSEYSKTIAGIVAGQPPAIDLAAEKRLQQCMVALASSRLLQSAHDVSDGGLAVTLAESCFAAGPGTGAWMTLQENSPAESALFGERGARAVVSISPAMQDGVLNLAREHGVSVTEIGHVTGDGIFSIQYNGSAIIEESTAALRDIWSHSLERALKQ